MSFVNKVVLITGAASGMGAAIALAFAKQNASLCIIDINKESLIKTKQECEEHSEGTVLEVVADISNDEDVKNVVACALKEFKKIDVLVNCAGILGAGGLQDPNFIEVFDKVISVNLRAMIVLTKEALFPLIESKGCIINISSAGTSVMLRNMVGYSTSKAGVTSFTKNAAFDLARFGVRVNCISPGPVKTNIYLNAGSIEHSELWDSLAKKTLMKTLVKPEEIAALAVYLASDEAASITGSDFVADAGMSLGSFDDALDCNVSVNGSKYKVTNL